MKDITNKQQITKMDIAQVFDVPPWSTNAGEKPRFARVRWALRRVWPNLVYRQP